MNNWRPWVIIGLTAFTALLGAINAAEPGSLGIPPLVVKWLVIAQVPIVLIVNQMRALGERERRGGRSTDGPNGTPGSSS